VDQNIYVAPPPPPRLFATSTTTCARSPAYTRRLQLRLYVEHGNAAAVHYRARWRRRYKLFEQLARRALGVAAHGPPASLIRTLPMSTDDGGPGAPRRVFEPARLGRSSSATGSIRPPPSGHGRQQVSEADQFHRAVPTPGAGIRLAYCAVSPTDGAPGEIVVDAALPVAASRAVHYTARRRASSSATPARWRQASGGRAGSLARLLAPGLGFTARP
jgi:hypothetical protein